MGLEKVVPRIPVVELSGEKLKAGSDSWNSAREEVRKALENYGCFELIYNKDSIMKHDTFFEAAEELFQIPEEIKLEHVGKSYASHGFTVKTPSFPIMEYVKIIDSTNKQECQNFTGLMFPNGNQHFCDTVHSYAILLGEIQELVVKMLFESYGIEKQCIESHLKASNYLMQILKYERSNSEHPNLGFLGHTDKSFLTIIHQNQVKGLEMRLNDGEDDHWVFYEPSSDHSSFLVLSGDIAMGWSNDRLKSCYHRVVMEGEDVRYSIGFFGFITGMIEVPKELVDEEHPLKYNPFDQYKYIEFFLSDPTKYDVKSVKGYCGVKYDD
ncbi:2-oxoglutarate (2OG) and Fe(II)-dependent oxygenase superfamily protein [Euphorbia peplus]|nr:2-oxoglutarate (2OG) and Fe(II)-dependent oxygenase superfamily protein [Euphorbia peplus]